MKPYFTIIVPTYERDELLSRALNSIIKQSFENYQCIVIDDGSKQTSQNKPWNKYSQIEYYYFSKNHGVSWARNQGFNRAQGEWIAFLDSDDEWHPDKLKACKQFIEKHPQYLIFQTEEIWIRFNKRVNPHKHHLKKSGDLFSNSLSRCSITPSSVVIHRSILSKFHWDEKLPACEDYDLWLQITSQMQVGLLPQKLTTRYQGHPHQLSATYPTMDYFRIYALKKFIRKTLSSNLIEKRNQALAILQLKTNILLKGAQKRKRFFFWIKLFFFYQIWIWVEKISLKIHLLFINKSNLVRKIK